MTKTLRSVLISYSETNIYNYYKIYRYNPVQMSKDYLEDSELNEKVYKEIVEKTLVFRDACMFPELSENKEKIENTFRYLFNPENRLNAQMRGPQIELLHRIYRDMAKAGNKIQNTGITAKTLSSQMEINSLETLPLTGFPENYSISHEETFKQGIDVVNIKVVAGFTGQNVVSTGDNLVCVPKGKKIVNNLPFNQNRADYFRYNTNTCIFEDHKNKSLGVMKKNPLNPGSYHVGAITSEEEKLAVKELAQVAKKDILENKHSRIHHLDADKNNKLDKIKILDNAISTGNNKHLTPLIGLAAVYSNKFLKEKDNDD